MMKSIPEYHQLVILKKTHVQSSFYMKTFHIKKVEKGKRSKGQHENL